MARHQRERAALFVLRASEIQVAYLRLAGEPLLSRVFQVCPACGFGLSWPIPLHTTEPVPICVFRLHGHAVGRCIPAEPGRAGNCNIGFCVQEGMRALHGADT